MAKYEEPFEETIDLYNQLIERAGLSNFVNITILTNNKAKEIFKVNKANELLKYRTGDDIIIVLNEKIFDQLTEEQRVIVAEESLASIHFDSEKDRIVISKPDVVTFSGILAKYSFDTWNVLKESITTLYNAEKQEEDETAAITK
ncbi:MAG: hypothetical protein E6R13_08470 [Spirochaetes bacterium]|nr:MAG: hypothetical protein E6R13_08470 [Spirochaetota bacterium]